MGGARPLRLHRALAALGLIAFLAHALLKQREGLLPELLWGCNLSMAFLILGFALEWDRIVGAAFLWRLVLGEPGFVVGLWMGERYAWTAFFVHLTPTALAALYLRRSGMPRYCAWLALAFSLALAPLGRWLGPADLNVNFAYHRLAWLEALLPGRWSYRLVALAVVAGLLFLTQTLSRRWFRGGRSVESREGVCK